jgi:hypothetical protein
VEPGRIADLSRFQLDMNLTTAPVGFTGVVASAFAPHWG